MLSNGESQQQVLTTLLLHKSGMSVDELADQVGISRNAINQHLMALEQQGYVRKMAARKTAGRPCRIYALTEDGISLFPKQYSWFSRLLIRTLREQMGQDQLSDYLYRLGVQMSADNIPRLVGKNRPERVQEIVKIMNEKGFLARAIAPQDQEKIPRIECKNCVYHDLAMEYPEVCRFDLGFLRGLMGADVEHQECMHRGGEACRFRFKPLESA